MKKETFGASLRVTMKIGFHSFSRDIDGIPRSVESLLNFRSSSRHERHFLLKMASLVPCLQHQCLASFFDQPIHNKDPVEVKDGSPVDLFNLTDCHTIEITSFDEVTSLRPLSRTPKRPTGRPKPILDPIKRRPFFLAIFNNMVKRAQLETSEDSEEAICRIER